MEKYNDFSTIVGTWESPRDKTIEFQIIMDIREDLTFTYSIIWDSEDLEDVVQKGRWILFLDKDTFSGKLKLEFQDRDIENFTFVYIPKISLNNQSTIDLLRSIKEKSSENLENREVLLLQDEKGGQFLPYFKK